MNSIRLFPGEYLRLWMICSSDLDSSCRSAGFQPAVSRICIPAGWLRWWRLFVDQWVPKRKAGRPVMESVDSASPTDLPTELSGSIIHRARDRSVPAPNPSRKKATFRGFHRSNFGSKPTGSVDLAGLRPSSLDFAAASAGLIMCRELHRMDRKIIHVDKVPRPPILPMFGPNFCSMKDQRGCFQVRSRAKLFRTANLLKMHGGKSSRIGRKRLKTALECVIQHGT